MVIDETINISLIAHLGDIHIRKSPSRNEEYQKVFNSLILSLQQKNPNRIVIVGDLFHNNLDLQTEQLIMAGNLLNELANIAPVRITRGNHDFNSKNPNRIDSVKAIVDTLNNNNIIYYDKTGFYYDDNVVWAVWHHGEKNNNPWKLKEGKKILANKDSNKIYIDLFHETINGSKSMTNFEMNSKSYQKITDFKGDYLMAGHIHKQQFFYKS